MLDHAFCEHADNAHPRTTRAQHSEALLRYGLRRLACQTEQLPASASFASICRPVCRAAQDHTQQQEAETMQHAVSIAALERSACT